MISKYLGNLDILYKNVDLMIKAQLSYLLNKDNCLYTISGGIMYLSLTVIVLVYVYLGCD